MKRPKPQPAEASLPVGDATSNAIPHAETAPSGGAAARLRLEPGAMPVPDYQLVEFLGRGGYGEVWKARGPGGYVVALKFIPLGENSSAAEERSAELLKAKDIRHPNLLGLIGSWRRDEQLILAMELADGTLMNRLNEARRNGQPGVPAAELREYMREAAKGLDHLHAIGVQHRDVKPQNLLLVGGGVKVADFGLAKVLEQTSASNTGSMTPAYAAPEFLKGRVSPHSDQYSLAVAYCQLRGGKLPFNGGPAQLLMGHLYETPDLTGLPDSEQPAVLRALAKDPNDRWPSCREFVEALVGAATKQGARPKPAQPAGKRPAPPGSTGTLPTDKIPSPQAVGKRSGSAALLPSSRRQGPNARGPRKRLHLRARPWVVWTVAAALVLPVVVAAGIWIWMNRLQMTGDNTSPATHAGLASDHSLAKDPNSPNAGIKAQASPPAQSVLRLAPIAPVILEKGNSAVVKMAVSRDDRNPPIEFRLEGLPDDVKVRQLAAEGNPDAASFELTAGADAATAQSWAKATARVGDVRVESAFHLTVAPAMAVKPGDGGRTAAVHIAIQQGREHLAKSEWGQARASFGVAIELDANNAEAYAYRAKTNYNAHKYDDALEDCDTAISLDPKSALAHGYRCEVYADKGDLDKAIADGDQAVQLDPKSALARRSRGYAYSTKGDKDAALLDFNEAIRLDPAFPDPYIDRGSIRFDAGSDDDALKDFDQAVALAPKTVGGYLGRSSVHERQEKWDMALDDLNQAVLAAPKDADALLARGQYHQRRADPDKAVADFRAAVRVSPKLAEPHLSLAGIYVEKADADRAIEEYSEAIELDKKNAGAYNGRAWQRYAKADYDNALGDFDEAILLDDKNANHHDGRGWCHYRKGDYDTAIEDFGKGLDLEAMNADALAGRGWSNHELGKNDLALDDLNASLQINPKDGNNFNERGLIHYDLGDNDKAIADYTASIDLLPNDPVVYMNRANAYEKNGDNDKAEADRKKAEELKAAPK